MTKCWLKLPNRNYPNQPLSLFQSRKRGESYESILENDNDYRIAVSAVQQGFEACDITTQNVLKQIEAMKLSGEYEENAGATESNDKQLFIKIRRRRLCHGGFNERQYRTRN